MLGLLLIAHDALKKMQVKVDHQDLVQFGFSVLRAIGCDEETAKEVCPCVCFVFVCVFVFFCPYVCSFLPLRLHFFACVFVFLCLLVCISGHLCESVLLPRYQSTW